jgi:hypothetical protein
MLNSTKLLNLPRAAAVVPFKNIIHPNHSLEQLRVPPVINNSTISNNFNNNYSLIVQQSRCIHGSAALSRESRFYESNPRGEYHDKKLDDEIEKVLSKCFYGFDFLI